MLEASYRPDSHLGLALVGAACTQRELVVCRLDVRLKADDTSVLTASRVVVSTAGPPAAESAVQCRRIA